MPKRLIKKIKKIITRGNTPDGNMPVIIGANRHSFDPSLASPNAIRVVDTLTKAGYEAYLVGGCVRDGLLDLDPKDFDVSTDAHPEEIKALFRNCRLIGRRFRLAHIRYGREIIEVATFRGSHSNASSDQQSSTSDHGMLLRDNVFGNLDEDAVRRDFTANALYYRHEDQAIVDYVNGFEDIQNRCLRLIGDPELRYKEDPVRMLRAIRFSAKLDFDLSDETEAPIRDHSELLGLIPAARLFDEVQKLFMSGVAVTVWDLLQHYDLARWLFPSSVESKNKHPGAMGMIDQAMINTDERIASGKSVTPAFFYAVMLWGPLQTHWEKLKRDGIPPVPALQQAIQRTLQQQAKHTTIPKRFVTTIREIWELQPRLTRRHIKRAQQLVEHQRFRAAYDLLLLREQAEETPAGLGEWWTEFQHADPVAQKALAADHAQPRKKRRPPRRKRRDNQQ
ncbi:poly(A) polymerase [Gammaproteobacteria bacterium 45_16_T64]|nr:poly(A) polymerase [Gammaproteobacteria bacterium 45_16_T64]